MAKPKIYGPYRRVAPVRRHLGGYSSLWLASDHVLVVNSTGYSDSYKRFYLRDIQGFLVEDSERRFYWGLVLGLLLAGLCAIFLLSGAWPGAVISAVLLGIPLVVNWVKGPSCVAYVITQVQSVKLDAIGRRAGMERFIADVGPAIEAAQSDMPRPGQAAQESAGGGMPEYVPAAAQAPQPASDANATLATQDSGGAQPPASSAV